MANVIDWVLFLAIEEGNTSQTIHCLQNGANANFCEPSLKNTPLHRAVAKNDLHLCKILIDHDANLDVKNCRGETPLLCAFALQRWQVATLLLNLEVDVNCQDRDGNSPLHYAVEAENLNVIKLLLTNNAKVLLANDRNQLPLHCACERRNFEIVKLLLEKESENQVNQQDVMFRESPLHISARFGDVPIVKRLLKSGADVELTNICDQTAFHVACKSRQMEMAVFLFSNGAKVDFERMKYFSPLHYAVVKRNEMALEIFLAHDANVNYVDRNKKTALDIAFDKGYVPEMKILIAHIQKRIFFYPLTPDNFGVSEQNLDFVNNFAELKDFSEECKFRLIKFKEEAVLENFSLTLHDLFVNSVDTILPFLRNYNMRTKIRNMKFKKKFHMYATCVAIKVLNALEKAEIVAECQSIIEQSFQPELPSVCVSKILSYLDKDDMKMLITCRYPKGHLRRHVLRYISNNNTYVINKANFSKDL